MNETLANRRQENSLIRRGRQVTLVLLIVFSALPVLGVIWAVGQSPPRVGSFVGGLVGSIPIVTFLVLALVRMPAVRRTYWFLPLYFFLRGLGRAISTVINAQSGAGEQSFAFQLALSQLLPEAILGVALYVFRPRDEIEDDAA